jgi:hypothetical protein
MLEPLDFSSIYGWLRTSHIGAGFLAIFVYWLPLLAQKGSRIHVVCGRIFVLCAAFVPTSALVVCAWRFIDPIGSLSPEPQPSAEQAAEFVRLERLIFAFLGALAFYTLVPLVLGVRVIRTRAIPDRFAESGIRFLIWLEIAISVALITYATAHWIQNPAFALSGVPVGAGIAGMGAAYWDLRFTATPPTSPMFWWYKHMEFMLRTGIAFHTAFVVFVLTPWFGSLGIGSWAFVPWLLPSLVGIPTVWLWIQSYRRKFDEVRS